MFWGLRAILDLGQTLSTQGLKCCICPISQNSNFKVDLDTHFKDRHGHLCLWDLELFWPSLKDCQTKVEKMHFFFLFQKWNLKVDLGTHFNKQAYKLTFVTFRSISVPLSATLAKAHDKVSLLTNFLELKYDLRFGCTFGR